MPLAPMLGSQEYMLSQMEAGLERGVREYVFLKARQLGATTLCDALDLWWPMSHDGVLGMVVLDDDPNIKFRRDVMKQMLSTLPRAYRQGVRVDNEGMLAFASNPKRGFTGSRLMFAAAGKRTGGNLGRSRGLNYAHGDELAWWADQRAFSGFRASLAKEFTDRLYLWPSTANGDNLFRDLWRTALRVPDKMAVFVGWWMNHFYRLKRDTELWDRYGEEPPSPEELQYMKHVHSRYGWKIEMEQIAWRRHTLESEFNGDEAMLAQEYPWLPEDAFQYFGDAFIEPQVVRRLRDDQEQTPDATGYRYEWGQYLNDLRVREDDPEVAPLRVWEACDPAGLYVVAAHPQLSSSDRAKEFVIGVWRCYPERLVQVAEYASDRGYMHKFGWAVLHLCAAYRTHFPPSLIMEIQGPGIAAYDEMKRIEEQGWGVRASDDRNRLLDAVSAIMYLFRRTSSFTGTVAPHMKANQEERDRILYAMRDCLERGYVGIRSPELIDQLASLRRGEDDDNDLVAGGGSSEESRAYCLALAIEQWLKLGDLTALLARDEQPDAAPLRVENVLVANFIGSLGRGD